MSKYRIIGDWLLYCANPFESHEARPRALLDASAEEELLRQSERHGVLPAFLRRFPFEEAVSPTLKQQGRDRNRGNQLISGLLRHHSTAAMADAAGLEAAIVKGPVFAQVLYPEPTLRSYTDVDILAASAAVPPLAAILEAHGFARAGSAADDLRGEWKWVHRANAAVMIEVQTDLVHAPAMRRAVSLRFEDIGDAPSQSAALLLVALVHAGAAHQFDRLQLVVDICHAARALQAAGQECRFESMIERTGARLAAVIGLEIAGSLFQDRRCRELANALKPARFSGIARRLLGRSTLTSTMGDRRALYSWRRQIVRELIKRGRTAA